MYIGAGVRFCQSVLPKAVAFRKSLIYFLADKPSYLQVSMIVWKMEEAFAPSRTAKEQKVLPLDCHWADTALRQRVVYGIITVIPVPEQRFSKCMHIVDGFLHQITFSGWNCRNVAFYTHVRRLQRFILKKKALYLLQCIVQLICQRKH